MNQPGNEVLFGVVRQDDKGFYIEEVDRCIAFSLPAGMTFSPDTPVRFLIPNPTPGVFLEDYHDQVIHVEEWK